MSALTDQQKRDIARANYATLLAFAGQRSKAEYEAKLRAFEEGDDSDSDSEEGIAVEIMTKDGIEYLVEEGTGIVYDQKEWCENEKMVKVGMRIRVLDMESNFIRYEIRLI